MIIDKIIGKDQKENNIIDYLLWRGDVTFAASPFNELDGLILSQLSYLHFDEIAPNNFNSFILLSELAEKFYASPDFETRSKNGPFINTKTVELLKLAGESARFKNTKIYAFVDDLNYIQEKQFSAFTAVTEDNIIFVAYRGTHNEIVGWKEDFNMAFETPVPAQIDAANYLNEVAASLKGKIRIGGHSKGGNLAMYAAAFCNKKTKARIETVFNNDGQGFNNDILNSPEFEEIVPRLQSFSPQSSVVGMLLEHKGPFSFIDSSTDNILFQHDAFTWQVLGTHFVTVNRSNESIILDKTMKNWLEQMDMERREQFIDTLFGLFKVSGASTVSEFKECWLKASPKILHYIKDIDEQTKKDLHHALKLLFASAKEEIKQNLF